MLAAKMKIAVLGCGAMGSIYAAMLSEYHEVTAIDVWQEHVEAINSSGLQVEESSGKIRLVKIAARMDHLGLSSFDLAIIATKASDVAEAARTARKILKDNGLVLSIQNGLGCADILLECFDDSRIFLGIASSFGACMKVPGHAFYENMGRILIGAMNAADAQPALQRIVSAWKEAGFPAEAVDDIQEAGSTVNEPANSSLFFAACIFLKSSSMIFTFSYMIVPCRLFGCLVPAKVIWKKFINNCANSACCTICRMSVGEMMANDHARSVAMACAVEAFHVAKAKGILVNLDVEKHVSSFNEKVSGARPSMLQDWPETRVVG